MDNVRDLPTLRISEEMSLPDNDQWQLRFEIPSATSGNIYTIAQNKKKRFWGCSCAGWKKYRKCTHLKELGLPWFEKPHEVNVIKR